MKHPPEPQSPSPAPRGPEVRASTFIEVLTSIGDASSSGRVSNAWIRSGRWWTSLQWSMVTPWTPLLTPRSVALVTLVGLEEEVARLSCLGRRGVATLRRRLNDRGFLGGPEPSVLESRTLRLLADAQIAVTGTQVVFGLDGEYRLDITLTEGVALEVDGYMWHFSPEQKACDETRRRRIRLAGISLLVYGWRGCHQRQRPHDAPNPPGHR
jgi:hypothetical protein